VKVKKGKREGRFKATAKLNTGNSPVITRSSRTEKEGRREDRPLLGLDLTSDYAIQSLSSIPSTVSGNSQRKGVKRER